MSWLPIIAGTIGLQAIGQDDAGKVRVEKARQRQLEMMADKFAQESKDAKEENVEETTLQEQGEHDVMDQRQSQHDEHGAPAATADVMMRDEPGILANNHDQEEEMQCSSNKT